VTANAARARSRAIQTDRPSLKEAVLLMMAEFRRPVTALELTDEMRDLFKTADLSGNYVHWVLSKLEPSGLIASGPPAAELDRLGRTKQSRTFQITEQGIEHVRNWLRSPVADAHLRDEMLVRIQFCPEADVGILEEHVSALKRRALDQLYTLKSETAAEAGAGSRSWARRRSDIRKSVEVRYWEAQVQTLEHVQQELKAAFPDAQP
jgi:DNA-binding PadR family transcriptional regulator